MASLFRPSSDRTVGPSTHSESTYSYLCRSDRPAFVYAREVLENWFSEYPASHSAHLRTRFQAKDDLVHSSALAELATYHLLRRLNCTVTMPPLGARASKYPDFECATQGGERFFVETTAIANEAAFVETPAERSILDAIEAVRSPRYWINVSREGRITRVDGRGRFQREVQRFVDGALIGTEATSREFEIGDGHVTVSVFPRRHDSGGRALGASFGGAGWGVGGGPVASTVAGKANHYKELEAPLVLIVNSHLIHDIVESFEAGLFGPNMVPPDGRTDALNGAPALVGRSGPRNTRLSAVVGVRNLQAWTLDSAETRLFRNPWARFPAPHVLGALPACNVIPGEPVVRIPGASSLGDLLGVRPIMAMG